MACMRQYTKVNFLPLFSDFTKFIAPDSSFYHLYRTNGSEYFLQMHFLVKQKRPSWLPHLNSQVWILGFSRFLCEVGNGLTLFYAPLFFVNQVGLSTTQVGIALSCASISGIFGRIMGGSFADSQFWGRRRTLLLSAAIIALATLALATTNNFSTLVNGNLLIGLGNGLYGPAITSLIADVTPSTKRLEAFALSRMTENLGLGMGIVLGGALVAATGAYRLLFIVSAFAFALFFAVVYFAIEETYRPHVETLHIKTLHATSLQGWATALRDRRLFIYVLVNIIFTTYCSQLFVTLPLYLKNYVPVGDTKGFAEVTVSELFGLHLAIAILLQLPVTHALKRFTHPQALTISAWLWGLGFCCVWLTTESRTQNLNWIVLGLGLLAIAIVCYIPFAASLVTNLAKESQRGVYFSINSLCWAVGYFIGPTVGGYALEKALADDLWLGLALSVLIAVLILHYLNRLLHHQQALIQ